MIYPMPKRITKADISRLFHLADCVDVERANVSVRASILKRRHRIPKDTAILDDGCFEGHPRKRLNPDELKLMIDTVSWHNAAVEALDAYIDKLKAKYKAPADCRVSLYTGEWLESDGKTPLGQKERPRRFKKVYR